MSEVQRPASATNAEGKDLLSPTTSFLNGVGFLPDLKNPERTEASASPEDNSLQISKSAKDFAQWATGGGAGVSIIGAILAATVGQSELVVASMALATAIIVAVGSFSVAKIAAADSEGRNARAAQALRARAEVAKALLTSYDAIQKTGPVAAKTDGTPISRDGELQLLLAATSVGIGSQVVDGEGHRDMVRTLRWSKSKGLEVQLQSTGDYVEFSELKELAVR